MTWKAKAKPSVDSTAVVVGIATHVKDGIWYVGTEATEFSTSMAEQSEWSDSCAGVCFSWAAWHWTPALHVQRPGSTANGRHPRIARIRTTRNKNSPRSSNHTTI